MSGQGERIKAEWVWDPFRIETEPQSLAAARCGAIVSFFLFLEFAFAAIAPILANNSNADLIVVIVNVTIAAFFLFLTTHIYRHQVLWAAITVTVFFALTVVNAIMAMRAGHLVTWLWILPAVLGAYLLLLGGRGTLKLQEIRRLRNVIG